MRLLVLVLALGQFQPDVPISLPAAAPVAKLDLAVPGSDPVDGLRFKRPEGTLLSPQPVIQSAREKDVVHLDLSALHFWGAATLDVAGRTFKFRRGPILASAELTATADRTTDYWLYNDSPAPLPLRWRLTSGADVICGIDQSGAPKRACTEASDWGAITIPPAMSKAIRFRLPEDWFAAFQTTRRPARLELLFGDLDTAPMQAAALNLTLEPLWFNVLFRYYLGRLFFIALWVTLGAAILMIVQVMLPAFRKTLLTENRLDLLQERFSAVGSRVGSRLCSRFSGELKAIRSALMMAESQTFGGPRRSWILRSGRALKAAVIGDTRLWRRLFLFGNAAEVNRLAKLTDALETRIALIERLDEIMAEQEEAPPLVCPQTIRWRREQELQNVKAVLGRQVITEAEARSAMASLTNATAVDFLLKDFPAELESRIDRLRQEYASEPWKSRIAAYLARLPTVQALLANAGVKAPEGGWSEVALFQRDLDAIRLTLLYQFIALEARTQTAERKEEILTLLESSDYCRLGAARNRIAQISEGIFEDDLRHALSAQEWDTWYEPDQPNDQDVVTVSLRFRNDLLNKSAAREHFDCYWRVDSLESAAENITDDSEGIAGDRYEHGWEVKIVPRLGRLRIVPEVYRAGEELLLQPPSTGQTRRRSVELTVVARQQHDTTARFVRGASDAILTALVPVMTVAVAQAQGSSSLHWLTLVSLGFTSQAIRAAVVPESVNPSAN